MAQPYLPAEAVFGISVVARMVGTGVQNLRAYERAGLVEPQRTTGGTRLYSSDEVERLRRVADLLERGLNLAGIAMVLELEAEVEALRAELRRQDDAEADRRPSRARQSPTNGAVAP